MSGPLSEQQLDEIRARLEHAREVAGRADWILPQYEAVRASLADEAALLAEVERLRKRVAELEESPLAWAEQLDAKSLDNLLITLSQAADYEPMSGAIDQIHELLAGFRQAVRGGAS